MTLFNKRQFCNLYLDHFERIKNEFQNALNKTRNILKCKGDWETEIHSRLSNVFKDQLQTQIFLQAKAIYDDDKNLEFEDAVEIYCNSNNLEANTDILAHLWALHKVRRLIWDTFEMRINESDNTENNKGKIKTVKQKRASRDKSGNTKLTDVIINEENYNYLIKSLVKEGYYDEINKLWIRKGKGSKQMLCSLLVVLIEKGYYPREKIPTYKTMVEIARNTFMIKLTERSFYFPNVNSHKVDYAFLKNADHLS